MIISTARKRPKSSPKNAHPKTIEHTQEPKTKIPRTHCIRGINTKQNKGSQTARRRYLHVLADIVKIFVYLCGHVAEAVSIEDRAVLDIDAGGIENVAV